jgi:SAM-dependent methyltransferase
VWHSSTEVYLGRFGKDPHAFFGVVYVDTAPWEVGGAQPAMARLLQDFPPTGTVLDLGSATGDLAIHLARSGHRVLGVEFVESAVLQACEKAAGLPPEVAELVSFRVADATRPSALGLEFSAAVDSGFLHLLDSDETDRFVEDLGRALGSGGRYYLHEFAIEFPMDNVPRAITREEIDARFNAGSGWRVLDVRNVEFLNRVAQPTAAIAACIERL